MEECGACKKAVICDTWGEIRCMVLKRTIMDPKTRWSTCDTYVEGTNESVCRCSTCETNRIEEE